MNVKQIGHAILTLTHHSDEAYYIPLTTLKVKGILTGTPYPELSGSYKISSTTGYVSTIDFTQSKSLFSPSTYTASSHPQDHFVETLYHDSTGSDKPLYKIEGQWTDSFTIHDCTTNRDIETFSTASPSPGHARPITVPDISEQSPWESRRAWADVVAALNTGNMQGASDAKSKLERAQREARKREAADHPHGTQEPGEKQDGADWQRCFFRSVPSDEVFENLASMAGEGTRIEETLGIWKVKWDAVHSKTRPFREGTPYGTVGNETAQQAKTIGHEETQSAHDR